MHDDSYVIVFIFAILLCWFFIKTMQPKREEEQEEEDEPPDFEYLTVREQLATAKATSDALGDMEQLITDMETCSEDNIKVIHIEWLGEDDKNHSYDLYADGSNTVTECIEAIAEREQAELRRTLAYQCSVLSKHTRSMKNCAKNYAGNAAGEGSDIGKTVRDLWENHQH